MSLKVAVHASSHEITLLVYMQQAGIRFLHYRNLVMGLAMKSVFNGRNLTGGNKMDLFIYPDLDCYMHVNTLHPLHSIHLADALSQRGFEE